MQPKTQKALLINAYGQKPHLKQDHPIPTLNHGELLVKVEGSTINPSDRIFLQGAYFKRPLPSLCGIEGSGTVVEAKGEALQSWVGKRVCFTSESGSWCEYAVAKPVKTFEIEKDVPLSCASSGIVNPLTVIGFIENFKTLGCKGIIHTAAASALGRMLVKICKKENIPLLNIVRRQEQAQILKKEGATHILVTNEGWQNQLKEHIQKHSFDCIYDALGGGPVTDTLIANLKPNGVYHLYGVLEPKPITISNPSLLFSGVKVTGFLLFSWWIPCSEEIKERVRKEYSALLKNQLSTQTYKEITLGEIGEGLELSVSKANEGKILIKF